VVVALAFTVAHMAVAVATLTTAALWRQAWW